MHFAGSILHCAFCVLEWRKSQGVQRRNKIMTHLIAQHTLEQVSIDQIRLEVQNEMEMKTCILHFVFWNGPSLKEFSAAAR